MNTKIPLVRRIKKESHRKLSLLHDLLVKEIYTVFPKAVFHGGTALWRCYAGKRFSEDLDFYLSRDLEKIEALFLQFEKKGFQIRKKKILKNSIYSELEYERVVVRFEATFQHKKGHLLDYENIDGTYTSIYSLTPEEFLLEKLLTYRKRRKIRDLYDIYFLTSLVIPSESLSQSMLDFLKNYEKALDESNLQTIIIEGIVPKAEEMLEYLRRTWERKNM